MIPSTPESDPDEIPDGRYDVFVVDTADVEGSDGAVQVSLTILSGPLKSRVLDLTATGLGWSSIDLIGMPGTLVVSEGSPSLTIDD